MKQQTFRLRPAGAIDDATRQHIQGIRALRPEEFIRVWTTQHEKVVSEVIQGEFRASWDKVPKCRLTATQWMANEKRDAGYQLEPSDAPIWVLLTKPEPKAHNIWGKFGLPAEMRLLELYVRRDRLLLSFHFPWSTTCLDGQQVFSSHAEREESEATVKPKPPMEEVRKTWRKVFDLSLVEHPETSFWNLRSASDPLTPDALFRLQGTMTFLTKDDVACVYTDW